MAMNDIDRRKEVRARITIPVQILRRSERVAVQMIDASFRGLFLRVTAAPQVRELVKLRIELPTRELVVHAVVVRHTPEAGGRVGVGLSFFALNGQDKTDWQSFITNALHARARAA